MTNQDKIIAYLENYAKKRPIVLVAGDHVSNNLDGFEFDEIEQGRVYAGIPINGEVLVCWGRDSVDYVVHGAKTVILPDCQRAVDGYKDALVSYDFKNGKCVPYSVTPIKVGDTICV